MKNKLIFVLAAIVLVVAAASFGVYYYFSSNNYVATVAGEKVIKYEYSFFLAVAKQNMESTASLTTEEAKKNFWKDKEEVVKNSALDMAKDFKIQLIKAKENKIALSSEDNKKINDTIKVMTDKEGRAKAEANIKGMYNISLDQYKSMFADYIIIDKFVEAQKKEIKLSDDDIKKGYEINFENSSKVTVRHILRMITDPNTQQPLPEEKQAEAKKTADEVLNKVKAGADFAALAKQYSEDPGSIDNSGQYTFEKGRMVKEFEEWSFSAKPGDVGLVKSQFGYHVMKKPTFDELKDQVKEAVLNEKYMNSIEQWKKDPLYNVTKNVNVFNSIKVDKT